MSFSRRPGRLWLTATGASALLLVLLFSLPPQEACVTTTVGAGGLRAQLDPETGAIVPLLGADKSDLQRDMANRLDRSSEGLTEVHHADGSVSIDLQGRFQSLAVATVDSNGDLRTGCVTSEKELEQFMTQPAAAKE